jgi:glycolate oxidase FAD binding subunit
VSFPLLRSGRRVEVGRFIEQCRQHLGPDSAVSGHDAAQYSIDGQRPAAVCYPASIEALSHCVASATALDLTVVPIGNGTQLHMGRAPRRYDVAVSTQRLNRILAHEAADLTVTVEAGTTLAELGKKLAAASQFLALDPAAAEDMTVGGVIATNASGPLRLSYGRVRDLLIGIVAVLADGTIVKGGGRVVKNVAGYDVMKLLTGSYGTLAIVAEATFKVHPRPAVESCFVVRFERIDRAVALGLQSLNATLMPAFLEAVDDGAGKLLGLQGAALVVGCHGSPQETEAQRLELEAISSAPVAGMSPSQASDLAARLRAFPAMASVLGCRIAAPVSRIGSILFHVEREMRRRAVDYAITCHVGNGVGVVRCSGEKVAGGDVVEIAEWIRAEVSAAEGSVVAFDVLPRRLKDDIDPWGAERALSAAQLSLSRKLKDALDPRGLLSPGRFVGGL